MGFLALLQYINLAYPSVMQKDIDEPQQKGQENPNKQDQDLNKQGEDKKEKISSKIKYAQMKRANVLFQRFFDNYLEKALLCPIGQQLMTDPVVVSSGHTFEKNQILESIRIHGPKCPISRESLKQGDIISNKGIKSLSQEYQQFLKNSEQMSKQQFLKKYKPKNPNVMTITQYLKVYTYVKTDYKKKKLDHSFKRIQMKDFLKCNWSLFEEMDLTFCQINDEGIELFLKHGNQKFKNIYDLHLASNKITTVSQLQRLPKLRRLNIENNPLSCETISYLKAINQKKGRLKVKF